MIYVYMTALIMIGVLFVQYFHYEFLKSQQDQKNVNLLGEELEKKLKEFDDYKKRVDALVLRAGFKL